jgi:hypothetical protein
VPLMDSGLLLDALIEEWMHDERTIESWRILLSLAALIDSGDVTKELMAKSKACRERAVEYKTPYKGPGGNNETVLPELEEFVYIKRITDPEVFAASLPSSAALLRLSQVIGELESQSINGAAAVRTLHNAVSLELLEGRETAGLLNSKIDQTQSRLGTASADLNLNWNSPTLWGVVKEMASFLDTLAGRRQRGQPFDRGEQEIRIKKLVSGLVEVQAKTAIGRLREGLVEQKPFILYARRVKNSIGANTAVDSTLGIQMACSSLNLFARPQVKTTWTLSIPITFWSILLSVK